MVTLEEIVLDLEFEEVKRTLRTCDEAQVQELLDVARPLIRARAVYEICYLDEKAEDRVVLGGVCLRSRVLRKNLDKVGRVFPYVVTIGKGLEDKADETRGLLEKYYLDTIGNIAVSRARRCLEAHLSSTFAIHGLSYMSPGSLEDWPIEEQRSLFTILKDVDAAIGVSLTESLLMIPRKSISGIYFPTEITFYSCQLCPRKDCVGRKAPYSGELAKKYGIC